MTRYSKDEFGGGVENDEKVVDMTVSITLQWMSGDDMNLRYDPRLGWYHLKREIMKQMEKKWGVWISTPNQIILSRKGWEEVSKECNLQEGETLYVCCCL